MPLYEYRCTQCGHQFEKIQTYSAADEKECPKCQGELERLISAPAIQFKGSGWYVNDYAAKSGPKSGASETSESKGAGESKGADGSKSDAQKSVKSDKPADSSKPPSSSSESSSPAPSAAPASSSKE